MAIAIGIGSIKHGSHADWITVEFMAEKDTHMVVAMSTWDTKESLATEKVWS